MEKFSINTLTSGKKEMKKVREYLRSKGFKVQKRKDLIYPYYLSNNNGRSIYEGEFRYEALIFRSELELTLPEDWDNLVKIIKYKPVEDKPVKEEFKEGDWVYVEEVNSGCLSVPNGSLGIISTETPTSGFIGESAIRKGNITNIKFKSVVWGFSGKYHRATPAEVQSHLESELKKRGFKKDCFYTAVRNTEDEESEGCAWYSKHKGEVGSCFHYDSENDILYNYGFGRYVIYEKGVFATLKETVPEICGYKLERAHGSWKFGCVEFDLSIIDRLRTVMSEAGITEITIKDEYKVTKSQIEEVYNYVESN